MSPWLPSALRVVVSPDQVTLLRMRRTLGWRGLRHTLDEARSVPCDSATGTQPWRAALLALETALPGFADGRTAATVILSNHFLRYARIAAGIMPGGIERRVRVSKPTRLCWR